MHQAEMELRKGQNMIDHENEIYSRPARPGFSLPRISKERKVSPFQIKTTSFYSGTSHLDISKQQYQSGFPTSARDKTGKGKVSDDPAKAGPPITGTYGAPIAFITA
jgi:ATP-dependent RNA helicase DDX27